MFFMPAKLFLSSRTATAYSHMVSQIHERKRTDILVPVTLLLPTAGVTQDLRTLLGDTIGVQIYQFYNLGQAVLSQVGVSNHQITDTAVRRLIRHILREMQSAGTLTTFEPVCELPGFVDVMLEWLREMKSQGIFPEQYTDHAFERGNDQDFQLADFYTRYQAFMQADKFADPDGILWVAAETLDKHPDIFKSDGALYVAGFDQFTPVQVRIVQQLVSRFRDFGLYLLWDDDRPEDSLALNRFRRTREILLERMQLEVVPLDDGMSNGSLERIHKNIFETGCADSAETQSLQLIEAPSREDEVRRIMRMVKRQLIEDIAPSKIAILASNKDAYLPIVRTVAAEYSLPIDFEHSLVNNPAVAALVNLLQIPGHFPWSLTIDILRSPYIRQDWLSDEQVDMLDQLSRERPVVAGRDQWSFAIQPLEMDALDHEIDDFGPPPKIASVVHEDLVELENDLTSFFDHLTPPESGSYREYTWWLQTAIIGCYPEDDESEEVNSERPPTLDLLGCCQESTDHTRDMAALTLVMQTLRRLLISAEIVPGETEVSWEIYRDELLSILHGVYIPSDSFDASVRFDQLEGGRARVVDYLYILGFSEGEFPSPVPSDPFYSPGERDNHPLPLNRFYTSDDASLWWQVISNVRQRLVILRPYIDENGAPWQPSPYWDAICACIEVGEIKRIPISDTPAHDSAASKGELLVVLAQAGAQVVPERLLPQWTYAHHAETNMLKIRSDQPPGEYEGILVSTDLRAELQEQYGEEHVWSASRLNRYANCPFGFFAEHVLKLKAYRDPDEGLDVMQRGTLLHAILEHLYQRLVETNTSPIVPNLEKILQYLDDSCAAVYPTAPRRYGFRPGALWEYEKAELQRLLKALVTWECEGNRLEARFKPYLQEAYFGIGQDGPPPLDVEGDQARYRVRGVIDRLDRDSDGNIRVIDYKSGSTGYSKPDLRKGLAMQTALYALTAEKFWRTGRGRVAVSEYWHIPSRESSGKLVFSGEVREDEDAETVIQLAARCVAQVRLGIFPSAPAKPTQWGGPCSTRCEYGTICRVTRESIVKARRSGLA